MVKQITIVPVSTLPIEEATPQVENIIENEEVPPIVQAEIDEPEPEPEIDEPEPEPEIIEIKEQILKVITEEIKHEKIKKVKK